MIREIAESLNVYTRVNEEKPVQRDKLKADIEEVLLKHIKIACEGSGQEFDGEYLLSMEDLMEKENLGINRFILTLASFIEKTVFKENSETEDKTDNTTVNTPQSNSEPAVAQNSTEPEVEI